MKNYFGVISRMREASATPGVIDVHIIAPGWGSSGYYPESTLQKAVSDKVYHAGMHMGWDHQTEREEMERPERSLNNLAGVLTQDAWYDANGWDGPGVYSTAKPFPAYADSIVAMGGHIGISHNVYGESEWGKSEGKEGNIITEIYPHDFNTVDFVTMPGAGGHYKTVFSEALKISEAMVPSNPSGYGKDPEGSDWSRPNLSDFTDMQWNDLNRSERRAISQHYAYAENLDSFASLKFPHHNPSNGNVVWRAVANAMARLNQSNISADMKSRVESHLKSHYKDFDKPIPESSKGGSMPTIEEVKKDKSLMEALRAEIMKESDTQKLNESLKESQAENATLKEALAESNAKLLRQEARTYALAKVAESKLPVASQKRVVEAVAFGEIPDHDSGLDTTEFDKAIEAAVKAEQDYIDLIIKESGVSGVHDLGKSSAPASVDTEKAKEAYRDELVSTGMSRTQANRVAGIKE